MIGSIVHNASRSARANERGCKDMCPCRLKNFAKTTTRRFYEIMVTEYPLGIHEMDNRGRWQSA